MRKKWGIISTIIIVIFIVLVSFLLINKDSAALNKKAVTVHNEKIVSLVAISDNVETDIRFMKERIEEEKERIRLEEEKRRLEEEKRKEEERLRLEEEKRKEEQLRLEETKRKEEERKAKEEKQREQTDDDETKSTETTQPPKVKPEFPYPGISAYEKEVVKLTNKERVKHGLPELKIDSKLSEVAWYKSKDMLMVGYFSHYSPTYGSPYDMMKYFGISYSFAGENIAYGYPTPEELVQGWMNSPSHRDNILNENFTHIGVGHVPEWDFATQMFIGK
jgi:uncharacterized YkwD family protein